MAKQSIRVAVIGAGNNTRRRHIPGLQAIDGVEIIGICNRSHESSKAVADEFNVPKVYDNWLEAIDDEDVDAVVIGTWPYLHCRASVAALEAEMHVMCEARMAMNANEARMMRDAARARPHLTAQIVPSPFTLGIDKTIKRLIEEGFLGEILAIEGRLSGGGFIDPDAPMNWRQDIELSGMNAMSMGIWYEALMRWVGDAARVSAMGKTFVKMRKEEETGEMRPVRVPEHIVVTADMSCGAQMHLMVSSVAGFSGPSELFLYGSEGTLRVAGDSLQGAERGDRELQDIKIPKNERGEWRVEEEFINSILGKEEIRLTTFEDGVKYMDFTEAVYRSMTDGLSVSLPLE